MRNLNSCMGVQRQIHPKIKHVKHDFKQMDNNQNLITEKK